MESSQPTCLVEKALQYAMDKHKGQYRKNRNLPYIWHCLNVSNNVESYKKSKNIDELICAALLHDVVENYKTQPEQAAILHEIADLFGFMVASLVKEVTTDKEECNKVGKTEYLKNKMKNMSSYALVIKLSDRKDNVSDLDLSSNEFKENYRKETESILDFITNHRRLTSTHIRIISDIREILRKYK